MLALECFNLCVCGEDGGDLEVDVSRELGGGLERSDIDRKERLLDIWKAYSTGRMSDSFRAMKG